MQIGKDAEAEVKEQITQEEMKKAKEIIKTCYLDMVRNQEWCDYSKKAYEDLLLKPIKDIALMIPLNLSGRR